MDQRVFSHNENDRLLEAENDRERTPYKNGKNNRVFCYERQTAAWRLQRLDLLFGRLINKVVWGPL